jgi:hypothetical protein
VGLCAEFSFLLLSVYLGMLLILSFGQVFIFIPSLLIVDSTSRVSVDQSTARTAWPKRHTNIIYSFNICHHTHKYIPLCVSTILSSLYKHLTAARLIPCSRTVQGPGSVNAWRSAYTLHQREPLENHGFVCWVGQ